MGLGYRKDPIDYATTITTIECVTWSIVGLWASRHHFHGPTALFASVGHRFRSAGLFLWRGIFMGHGSPFRDERRNPADLFRKSVPCGETQVVDVCPTERDQIAIDPFAGAVTNASHGRVRWRCDKQQPSLSALGVRTEGALASPGALFQIEPF
jgi:hypothetical protein